MKHDMRRWKQMLSREETDKIMREATNGVLSLTDADGEPYGVPLSYAYDNDGHIYFHCATEGHKTDCIAAGSRCSFCVVAQDDIMPEKFTTIFRSVIAKGRIEIVADEAEMRKGLLLLCNKYSPGIDPQAEIAKGLSRVSVLRLDIETITGKEAIELTRSRKQ